MCNSNVIVLDIGGNTLLQGVFSDQKTIFFLKEAIASHHGHKVETQTFVVPTGNVLDDSDLIRIFQPLSKERNIIFHVIFDPYISLSITDLSGHTVLMQVPSSSDTKSIKKQIVNLMGLRESNIFLLHEAEPEPLGDTSLISSFSTQNEEEIPLTLMLGISS